MIVKNENKIVMSCRVNEALKDGLDSEAQAFGITLSTYIETLLSQRNAIEQLETFAEENKRLRYENEQLHQKNAQQEAYIKSAEQYKIWYEPIHEPIHKLLKDLEVYHKGSDWKRILLYALGTSLQNEKNVFQMFTIKDFHKRNPNFITPNLKLNI